MKKITTQKELDKITFIDEDTIIEGDLVFLHNIEIRNAKVELRGKVDCGDFWLEVKGNNYAYMYSYDKSTANMRSCDESTANMRSYDKSMADMSSFDKSTADNKGQL